jgi:hypothetical protein
MMPNFPVAGLMLAALGVAAAGVDMRMLTLLCDNFPLIAEGSVSLRAKLARKRIGRLSWL